MKKLFIALFLLAFCVSISGAGVTQDKLKVIAKKNASAGEIGTIVHDNSFSSYTDNVYHDLFTTTTAGPVNYAHAYVAGLDGNTTCLSIYDSGGNELASCTVADPGTDAAGWVNCKLDAEVTLVAATTYYGSIYTAQGGAQNVLYLEVAGAGCWRDSETHTCTDAIGNPEEELQATDDLSIFFNNSAGDPN